jgi:hypothetical protein
MARDISPSTMRLRVAGVILLCAVCVGLMSCVERGASGGTTSSNMTFGVLAGDDQNGQSITLHPGQTLLVTLASTYWSIAGSSNANVLAAIGAPTTSPAPTGTCPVAGSGCGVVSETFRAVAVGTAQVTASRVSCGEAMRCTGANGHYQVTVHVLAA